MIRIRGQWGPWPVDLQIELDAADWAALRGALAAPDGARDEVEAEPGHPPAAPTGHRAPAAEDGAWSAAQALLAEAGAMTGPQLLEAIAQVAGGVAQAKRLIVRLRHSPQVRLEQGDDAAIYRWVG